MASTNFTVRPDRIKPLSVIYRFHNQPEALRWHLARWRSYAAEIRERIEFIIVDDCSTPEIQWEPVPGLNLSVYRVEDPIPWNCGAKNLGVKMASHEWFLLSDPEYGISEKTMEAILHLPRPRNYYYLFKTRGPRTELSPPRPLMMERTSFWKVGGLDEDFSGAYGGEDAFLLECLDHAGMIRIVPGLLSFDALPESAAEEAAAAQSEAERDIARNQRLLAAKRRTGFQASEPKIRFRWKRMSLGGGRSREQEDVTLPPPSGDSSPELSGGQ